METIDSQAETAGLDTASWTPFLTLGSLREWEARKKRWTIFQLLEGFRYVDSTLKRDRFFALLGIASDGHLEGFEPDYVSPLEAVIRKFAKALVDHLAPRGEAIKVLYRAGLSSQPDRFPSWVPDWTTEKPSSLYDPLDRSDDAHDASDGRPEHIQCNSEDELSVKGYIIDTVRHVSTWANGPQSHQSYFSEIDKMIDVHCPSHSGKGASGLEWKVPIAGTRHPEIAVSTHTDLYASYQAFRRLITEPQHDTEEHQRATGDEPSPGAPVATSTSQDAQTTSVDASFQYVSLLNDKVLGWRFLITEKKTMCGIAPENVQSGDMVAIFCGGAVPFVVRKSETVPGAYRLVGECYIHENMRGEALEDAGVVETMIRLH
ncbi:hypothetical protein LTR85_010947 [Meristemomyces frigidus]|nr:hypothetical protein LTR85_010947 [Meristemomyces frigidus]